jgi:trimeric autotransporter adhesin
MGRVFRRASVLRRAVPGDSEGDFMREKIWFIIASFSAVLVLSACQNKPGFELDFNPSRLEVIIGGKTYGSDATYSWGDVASGTPIVINGTLRNRSAFDITMTGAIPITVSGAQASDIVLTQPASSVIPAGSSQSFTLTITPQEMRARSAKLTIISTPGNDIFSLHLAGYRYGIMLLKDINPGAGSGSPAAMAVIGTNLYFRGNDGVNGAEPWISDGTTTGTVMIHNINAGASSSSPSGFIVMGSTVFFSANDTTNGDELWRTNGTSAGTFLVRNIRSGTADANPGDFCVFNGNLFFRASTGISTGEAGYELWKSDGTFANTVMVQDLNPNSAHGNYGEMFVHNSTRMVFSGDDGTNGREVFRTDGTINNITLVEDIRVGASDSSPSRFFSFNGATVFRADNGAGDYLHKITSASAGSASLVDNVDPEYFTILGNNLLFAGTTATNGAELWISDSSLNAAGTQLLKDITVGATGSTPKYLTTVASKVFFNACETATDCELWVTDGTGPGTVRLKDINPGAGLGSNPANLVALGSILYFSATDGVNGIELWRSDGTEAGTYMVADINSGTSSSSPATIKVLNGGLVFSATTAANGTELYMYVPPP